MKRFVLGTLLAAALTVLLTVAAHAQVHVGVQIGINLPGPPVFVVVPGTPVYYAPSTPANVFFYANQYWVFNGVWYVGPTWNGPWAIVQPMYVPAPILQIPVRYYRAPPPAWGEWRHDAPPHWEATYGHGWHEQPHERNWREHEERYYPGREKGRPPGHAKH